MSNQELVCNDGIDNDLDKIVDCDEDECLSQVVGDEVFGVSQAWSLVGKAHYCGHGLFGDYTCGFLGKKVVDEFQYELSWGWALRCQDSDTDWVDMWIQTDGGVVVNNNSPFSVRVYSDSVLEKDPDCYTGWSGDVYNEDCEYAYSGQGIDGLLFATKDTGCWCMPPPDWPASEEIAAFGKITFDAMPPESNRVMLVRWQYYPLSSPK